ncbi:MAG: hypothetical protein PHU12_02990 [Candidatus Aenigmarchaeota archaeon]|nr:hypothetical protein [Candidatus Aenigmarchaeota archaeon]
MDEINKIIQEKKITPSGCEYHTIRDFENNGRLRALVIKGDNVLHVEYICPNCGHKGYKKQEYVKVSKAASIRFVVECDKCKFKMKIEKLKGGKKKKTEE